MLDSFHSPEADTDEPAMDTEEEDGPIAMRTKRAMLSSAAASNYPVSAAIASLPPAQPNRRTVPQQLGISEKVKREI